jgi:hypothetical protein
MTVNEKLFMYVVIFLGVALLLCVGGIIFLVANDNSVPDILQNIASGVVAGLIGLLATPKQPTV